MFLRCGALGVVASIVLAIAACGSDDTKPSTSADGGVAPGASTARCHSVPNADDFCTCEVITGSPADEIPTCDTTGSPNIACCMQPGSTGAGNGHGLCGCKQISCSEFSDGSCTCRSGDASTERPIELCQPQDQGHCCKSDNSYCTCSASECFDGDTEVPQCDPVEMAKNACANGETKVNDCKAALK
jgi:hypothetical protein